MEGQSEITNLRMAIQAYRDNYGNPRRYYDGDPFKRLVELDPEAAADVAQSCQDLYDSEMCDLGHLPASMWTREDIDRLKDSADSSAAARDRLVEAGARPPVHQPCRHEQRGA
jgi:hypothetical protein